MSKKAQEISAESPETTLDIVMTPEQAKDAAVATLRAACQDHVTFGREERKVSDTNTQHCGNCRWFTLTPELDPTPRKDYGYCNCPLPDAILDDSLGFMRGDYGKECACWQAVPLKPPSAT